MYAQIWEVDQWDVPGGSCPTGSAGSDQKSFAVQRSRE